MAKLASNRASVDASLAKKLDSSSHGKVRWADLVDDQTTDPGDSPRSVASCCHNTWENQAPLERTLWADLEDSGSESSDETADATHESKVATPFFAHTIVKERGTTQDKLDVPAERRGKHESVGVGAKFVRANIGKHEMRGQGSSVRQGKGRVNNIGKGAGKFGGEDLERRAAKNGTGKGGKKGAGKGAEKYQCQFTVGIEEDSRFRVVRRVLGAQGENMKRISRESGAKLRLRGRGSKFLEGPEQKESDEELMLCVSSLDASGFEIAKGAVSELIEGIHQHYREFCQKAGHAYPELELKIHEGDRNGSR